MEDDVDTDDTRPVAVTDSPTTAEYPTVAVPAPDRAAIPPLPLDDDAEDWMASPAARGVRLRIPTLVLVALAVAAGAFWVGAVVQRHQGTTTSTASGLAAARRAGFGGAGAGATGAAGAGGAGGAGLGTPATRGLVSDVQASVLQITDSAGALVKVQIGPTTTVTRTGTGAPGTLQIGDTVTVRGSTGADGTIAATSIVATAQGLPATTGTGFGGGGFGGGGARGGAGG